MIGPIRPFNRETLLGFGVGAALAALIVALIVMSASSAKAGTVCRVQRVVKRVVVAAPVYQQYAPAYYQVGAQLQQQAVDTQGFRQSAEYLEYLQLKGFQAGVAAVQQQRVETTTAPPPVSTPEDFPRPTAPPNETLSSPPTAPGSPEWEAFKARYPTIAQNCSSCHGKKDPENPEAGLFLDGGMTLEGPESDLRVIKILRKAYNGHMPPIKPLDDATYGALEHELLYEPEPAPAPPGPST